LAEVDHDLVLFFFEADNREQLPLGIFRRDVPESNRCGVSASVQRFDATRLGVRNRPQGAESEVRTAWSGMPGVERTQFPPILRKKRMA
jgi:hypothetical protein